MTVNSPAAEYIAKYKADKAKTKAAPQKIKPTIVEDVVAKPVAASIDKDIQDLFAKYSVNVPSGTRVLVSYIAAFCIGCGIGYVGGMILEFLVVGALTVTGSLFLSIALYVLGVVAILMASYKVGGWVGHAVMDGSVEQCYKKCSNKVRGFFSFGNREVTA